MSSQLAAATRYPAIIAEAGGAAREKFIDFFTATIRNKNTRMAYYRAVTRFFAWLHERHVELEHVKTLHVAAYIEQFTHELQESGKSFASPTVKQHLAAIKVLFDYLVVNQVMTSNPAAPVKGPKYSIKRGKTPVLSAQEAKELIESIETTSVVGLRDRALIGIMLYSFSRVSAVVQMQICDCFLQGKRTWIRLHEKGGKEHEVPLHHKAEEYLDAYMNALDNKSDYSPIWRTTRGKTGVLTANGMTRTDVFRMVKTRALKAGLAMKICCHSFRATGITVFLQNGGAIETAAQIAAHESPRTTKLYDRRADKIALEEVERIRI